MNLVIQIGILIGILLLIEGSYLLFRSIRNPEKKAVKRRLSALSFSGYKKDENIDIVRKRLLSEVPWLNRLLFNLGWVNKLNLSLEQAGIKHTAGFFILTSILLAAGGYLVGSLFILTRIILIVGAAFLGTLPFVYIPLKKRKRMQRFEEQLPDALELIARSLKAGHAFSSGMKMVTDEFDDPIGTEFAKTLNEINFGVDVTEALKNLAKRVDCPDLNFFVISVILQKETGGNLAEILENIGRLIRERFKFYGRVRALTAEGRLSAVVLIGLPFAIAFVIFLLNPEYIKILTTDPTGKIIVISALILMAIGTLTMKKMIKIEV